jgi:hypothetical protein
VLSLEEAKRRVLMLVNPGLPDHQYRARNSHYQRRRAFSKPRLSY